MSEDEFIARSVALMLGGFRGPLDLSHAAIARALARSSGMAVAVDPARGVILVRDGDTGALREVAEASVAGTVKTWGAVQSVLAAGAEFPFVVDMQDRRAKSIAPEGGALVPVFAFNRLAGDGQRILWPLPIYQDFGSGHFVDAAWPDAVAWSAKGARVTWRGITGGRALLDDAKGSEGMRVKIAMKRFRSGAMTQEALRAVLMACPRYRVLELVRDDPRFDMGFVDGDGYVIAQTPLHAHLARPRLSREAMQAERYIAVLRGLDVGSSFYWVMHSGSLGFVMETPFETFASGHFRPMEHYLPFRMDGADLAERHGWAVANDGAAEAMARRAAEVAGKLARPDLRAAVLRGVVAAVAALPATG